jgi:23S rRNA pseudouridine2605 synthase
VLSKLGWGSRTAASGWVREGRVRVNGRVITDPEFPVRGGVDQVSVDGRDAASVERIVIMLNKPRGLVTTTQDERGRETVYRCLENTGLPWLAPVGRLDKASEGLLLFSNDPVWAAQVTDPASGPQKIYHVQVDRSPDASLLLALTRGVSADGDHLSAKSARILRAGKRNAWLEIVLEEGRNRQIRRLLAALEISVLRLVRIAMGPLQLGNLPKGAWRRLSAEEIQQLLKLNAARDTL